MSALASIDRAATTFAARIPPRSYPLIVIGLIALQALVLFAMGRVPICTCGTIKLWHGTVNSSENSQHIFDWYSLTHVLHGIWLYFFAWLVMPRAPIALRLVVALVFESAWEIVENTDFVIERYRAATVSLNYYGDTIVNSVADAFSMMFGFLLARLLPLRITIAIVVVIEFTLLYLIRDNLFFNILMLIYPIDSLKAWQAGLWG